MKRTRFTMWHFLILLFLISLFGWRIIPFLIFLFIVFALTSPFIRAQYERKDMDTIFGDDDNVVNADVQNNGRKTSRNSKGAQIPSFDFSQFSNFSFPMKSLFSFKNVSLSVLVIAVVLIIVDGLVSVPAGHVAVIFDRGRGVLNEELREGLHLKIPFWQVATIMDTRLRVSTMSIDSDEGDQLGDDSIEALTKDGQKVNVDVTVQYHLDADDASTMFQTKGDDRTYPGKIIRPGARSVVRDVITGYVSTQLFTQESRLQAAQDINDRLRTLYSKDLVTLDQFLLRNIRFSQVYLNSIEDKQVAEQRIQKADFERQEAEKRKEKKIIEAEAEAEAVRLKGEMLQKFPNVIQFEFVQQMADDIQWGFLPSDSVPLLDLKNLGLK